MSAHSVTSSWPMVRTTRWIHWTPTGKAATHCSAAAASWMRRPVLGLPQGSTHQRRSGKCTWTARPRLRSGGNSRQSDSRAPPSRPCRWWTTAWTRARKALPCTACAPCPLRQCDGPTDLTPASSAARATSQPHSSVVGCGVGSSPGQCVAVARGDVGVARRHLVTLLPVLHWIAASRPLPRPRLPQHPVAIFPVRLCRFALLLCFFNRDHVGGLSEGHPETILLRGKATKGPCW
mmetsp:Transcript_95672/g.160764  ORF Transcript_95672/g.160764 Transcript_95672/m.160764 type:complete len:235 (-) Transcript_95672:1267-1971(-)